MDSRTRPHAYIPASVELPPLPPSPPSGGARDVAIRLLARESGGGADDAALVAAAERVCTRLSDGLSRLFGPYGSRALFTRALARAKVAHASLSAVMVSPAPSVCLTGLTESARAHGVKATAAGIIDMVAALGDLIGRLIGDDLAVKLLDQSTAMTPAEQRPADQGDGDNVHQAIRSQ